MNAKENFAFRAAALESGLYLRQIASEAGISEPPLVRWLRTPLSEEREKVPVGRAGAAEGGRAGNMAPFLSICEARNETGLSGRYLRDGCPDGSVPCARNGRRYMINVPGLLRHLVTRSPPGKDGRGAATMLPSDLLGCGPDGALRLGTWIGAVRKMIRRERPRGCFLPESPAQVLAFCRSMRARAAEIARVADAVERVI